MKCPVCETENRSMVCRECGFDSSRDYGRFPAFGPVGKETAVSALQRERRKETQVEDQAMDNTKQWILFTGICLAVAFVVIVSILNLVGLTGGESGDILQIPPETISPRLTNVLCSEAIPESYHGMTVNYPAFGSEYQRNQIKTVTFLDTLADMPENAWDVSEAGNGAVMAWVEPNGNHYDLYIGGEGGVWSGASCETMFASYQWLEKIHFGTAFHTDNARNMDHMFSGCSRLKSLDLSGFDTANVQNMNHMFYFCYGLMELDLRSFDTSNVTDMGEMFSCCEGLSSLDLRGFDTANVANMNWMFYSCGSLTDLKLDEGFVTEQASAMYMFDKCPAGDNLTQSSTAQVPEDNVLRSGYVFDAWADRPQVEQSKTSSVYDSKYRREEIKSVTFVGTLADMPANAWDVSEAGNGKVMAWVKPNGSLYDLYIGGEGGIRTGESCEKMFAGYVNAEKISFNGVLDTSATQQMDWMFQYCTSLTEVDWNSFDTSNVKNMCGMFGNCTALTKLDLRSFNTSNVDNLNCMFENCSSLTSLDLSSFDTSAARSMYRMFYRCYELTDLKLGDRFETTNAYNADMFEGCPAGL